MVPQPVSQTGGQSTAPSPDQALLDALEAVYDPILWLRDTLVWLLEGGDLPKANAVLTVYLDLTQDAMELASDIVNRANQNAALAAATDGGTPTPSNLTPSIR